MIGRPIKVMINKKFGRLTVVSFSHLKGSRKNAFWNCKCDCGNEKIAGGSSLRRGNTKSCGCAKNDCTKNIVGKKFNHLTVKKFSHYEKNKAMWLCECVCGNQRLYAGKYLKNGNTTSCGCSKKKRVTTIKPITRLKDKMVIVGTCWMWGNNNLHNMFLLNGKNMGAHRASWILHKGEIPEGLFVCHHCDNPGCINPDHLFLGTAKDNSQDMIKKGRNNPKCKLNKNSVLKMKELKNKNYTYKNIAKMFDVSLAATFNAIKGITWKRI